MPSNTQSTGKGRRRVAALATAVALGLAGAAAVGYAVWDQQAAGGPVAQDDRSSPPSPTAGSASALSESPPTSITIPAIDVTSKVFPLGLNPDGTMAVPQPGPRYDLVSWYKYSPTPGELGPSVLTGHIDSAESGPSVFYNLDNLQPGDKVTVTRRDGSTATFTVDRVEDYDKDKFPTQVVYGDTTRPELRLISCGGSFDRTIGHYRKNIVVFGHLTNTGRV